MCKYVFFSLYMCIFQTCRYWYFPQLTHCLFDKEFIAEMHNVNIVFELLIRCNKHKNVYHY